MLFGCQTHEDDDEDESLTPESSPPVCSGSDKPEVSCHSTPEEELSAAAVPAAANTKLSMLKTDQTTEFS